VCANNISVFALTRVCKWGLLVSLNKLGTCESRFNVTAPLQSALYASHSDRPNAMLIFCPNSPSCPTCIRSEGKSAPFARDACGACNEDLMGHGPGCEVTTSPEVQATWNLLEPPSESSPGESGGVVLLGDTYGEDDAGGKR
jgi:hypothetical protein